MSLKKNILAFTVIGVLGTVSHFVYNWTGQNTLVGLFFPVNESVWEHLKLIFFPTVIYSVIEYINFKEKPENYLAATAIGIYCGFFAIIAIHYIAGGILGFQSEFINVGSYYVALIFQLCKRTKILQSGRFYSKNSKLFFSFLLIVTLLLFMIWSYNPPSLGIFSIPD